MVLTSIHQWSELSSKELEGHLEKCVREYVSHTHVDVQLNIVRKFAHEIILGSSEGTKKKINLRSIFDLFAEDFGIFPENVIEWLKKYLPEERRKEVEQVDLSKVSVKILTTLSSIERLKPLKPTKKREDLEVYKNESENLTNEANSLEKAYKELEGALKTDKQTLKTHLQQKEKLEEQLKFWQA